MISVTRLAALGLIIALCAPGLALAGPGHDHDHGPAAASGLALPRFTAESDLFELVGVLNGKQLTLYLDRFADNAPVPDAQIELDLAGVRVMVAQHGEAEYQVMLAEPPAPGLLPITATVSVGNDTDLLAGELDLHAGGEGGETAPARRWRTLAVWTVAGSSGLALLFLLARRLVSMRRPRIGGAA
jgi:hypothetical protein